MKFIIVLNQFDDICIEGSGFIVTPEGHLTVLKSGDKVVAYVPAGPWIAIYEDQE